MIPGASIPTAGAETGQAFDRVATITAAPSRVAAR